MMQATNNQSTEASEQTWYSSNKTIRVAFKRYIYDKNQVTTHTKEDKQLNTVFFCKLRTWCH